jgi:hypothetical protein
MSQQQLPEPLPDEDLPLGGEAGRGPGCRERGAGATANRLLDEWHICRGLNSTERSSPESVPIGT